MALRSLAAGALALVVLAGCPSDPGPGAGPASPTAPAVTAPGSAAPTSTPSPIALPSVDAATRRTLRRAAEAVLVPVEGYRLREPDGRAAAVITGLALPVIVNAFGDEVPPGMLMREVMQENSQYGFVLVTVVPRRDADQELASGAAFQLTGVLAQLQTPPAVEEIAGQEVNRLVNQDNAAHVVTWAPDGATVVAVVIFGPERAETIAEGLITGAR